MKGKATLCVIGLFLSAFAIPVQAHAETWDFLFEDLSWPQESNPVTGGWGGSIDNFKESGMDWGVSLEPVWDSILADTQWPDHPLDIESGWNVVE